MVVAPNLCGANGLNSRESIPLDEELAKQYPLAVVDNDCVTAVVAERLFGAGKGEKDVAYLTWSTGIGGGVYVDGHLLRGKNGNAGHIGHIFLAEKGPRCGCGNEGDFEALASGQAIARDYGGEVSTKEVFEAYRRGDAKAQEVVERAARNFAHGVVSLVSILDTKVVIVGGSVMSNNSDLLLPLVRTEFYNAFKPLTRGVDIKLPGLGNYLGDMAAVSGVIPEALVAEWIAQEPWKKSVRQINLG